MYNFEQVLVQTNNEKQQLSNAIGVSVNAIYLRNTELFFINPNFY